MPVAAFDILGEDVHSRTRLPAALTLASNLHTLMQRRRAHTKPVSMYKFAARCSDLSPADRLSTTVEIMR